MNISSVQPLYSTTSNDTITVSNGTGSSYYYTGSGSNGSNGTITFSSGMTINSIGSIGIGTGNVTIGGTGTSDYSWAFHNLPEEFVDTLPDINRIKKMCEQYPGLKIAYEKFKTTYYLIKDDYDTPEDQRSRP
jgi:hypothetical protein